MPEKVSPTAIFYGSSKPEQRTPPKREQSAVVSGVQKALNNWIERIGPKSVEDRFVKAHENVLVTLTDEERKTVFIKELDSWRKIGKAVGIAATVIDVSLVGVGVGLSYVGYKDPIAAINWSVGLPFRHVPDIMFSPFFGWARNAVERHTPFRLVKLGKTVRLGLNDQTRMRAGYLVSSIPALGSLGILLAGGPGHWLAHLAAGINERSAKKRMSGK